MTVRSDASSTRWRATSATFTGGLRWDVAAGTRAREGGILDEDLVAIDPAGSLVAVLDGFGGISSGGRAASLGWDAIVAALQAAPVTAKDGARGEVLGEVLASASAALASHHADPRLRGLGASAVIAWLDGRRAYLAHVGMCRAHVLREGDLVTVTRDHDLFRAALDGGASEGEAHALAAAHPGVLTRWLAMDGPCEADRVDVTMDDGDALVLTTDGVHGALSSATLAALLGGVSPAVAVERVLDAVAGADDATILVARPNAWAAAVTATRSGSASPPPRGR